MASSWSKDETLKLIEVWGDDAIQAQLEGCKRNQEVFSKISAEMSKVGYERTAQQCREKIKKLKVEYRKIKDKRNKTGEDRFPEWDFFDVLDAILGHKPATVPPVVVNSLPTTGSSELESESQSPGSPELFDNLPSTSNGGQDVQSRPSTPVIKERKRKRTSTKSEKVESIAGELISTIIDLQKHSDRLLLELEEKRLKSEEKQAEREAEQRREERMFQLQMMQMMSGSFYGPPPLHSQGAQPFAFGSAHASRPPMNSPFQSHIESDINSDI